MTNPETNGLCVAPADRSDECRLYSRLRLLAHHGVRVPNYEVGNTWGVVFSANELGQAVVTRVEEPPTREGVQEFIHATDLWLQPAREKAERARQARRRIRRMNEGSLI